MNDVFLVGLSVEIKTWILMILVYKGIEHLYTDRTSFGHGRGVR